MDIDNVESILGNMDLIVYDLLGRIVFTQKINTPTLSITTENLNQGSYIISLQSKDSNVAVNKPLIILKEK